MYVYAYLCASMEVTKKTPLDHYIFYPIRVNFAATNKRYDSEKLS